MALTAEGVLAHLDAGTTWADAERPGAVDLASAYRIALAVRALRIARGERPLGYKVGFTNRTIWERYGVYAPIWGPVWDTTVQHGDGCTVDLARTCEPRIEPEACFGIARTPPSDVDLDGLFDCVDWVAPSFEVVQSHPPGWKFTAPESALDGALHARLAVGRRTPVRELAASGRAFDDRLAVACVTLRRDEEIVESGVGANVLDGPLHALLHFVHELARCPGAPSLVRGDIVTTGTWTDAWPIMPGQAWRSSYDDALSGLEVTFR